MDKLDIILKLDQKTKDASATVNRNMLASDRDPSMIIKHSAHL
ncbi:hypothetical protein [Guptibacillus hwajinpoensis]